MALFQKILDTLSLRTSPGQVNDQEGMEASAEVKVTDKALPDPTVAVELHNPAALIPSLDAVSPRSSSVPLYTLPVNSTIDFVARDPLVAVPRSENEAGLSSTSGRGVAPHPSGDGAGPGYSSMSTF